VEEDNWSKALLKNIQEDGKNIYHWIIAINPHGNLPPPESRSATISWDTATFNPSGYYRLRQGYDGTGEIVIADMTKKSEHKITGGDSVQYFTLEYSTTGFNDVPKIIGDADGSGVVDLKDVIVVLRIMSGIEASGIIPDYTMKQIDADGDNKAGLPDAVFILQYLAKIRQQ
jgi:hypothetical protein